jgi:signal transduction histidine kinase
MKFLRRGMPLSLKVPLLAALLMVLVGIFASRQVLTSLGAVQDARLRELVRMHVDGLSVALGPPVLRQDIWEVFDTLDRAALASEGRRMVLTAVTDTSGKVLAATDPRIAAVGSSPDALFRDAQTVENLRINGDDDVVRVVAPLMYQGRKVGLIMTQLDASDLVEQRRNAAIYLLVGNALATGAITLAGYVVMRRMFRPVLLLARHIEETTSSPRPIAERDLPRSDSELARLFNTYNAMTGAVEAKAEAERRLAERERYVSLGRLSSSLAHEINNPLGGLLNATDTILQFSDRPEAVRQSARLIRRGLKHLRDVSRATLEQHRLQRDGARMTRDDFDDLRLLFEPETARLEQSLEWNVAALDEHLKGLPATQFRQVALNLLLNASAAAGKFGHVSLHVASHDDGLHCRFTDDGPGLGSAALKRLLTDEPGQPGGGVGLRIVRELVNGMGGHIEHVRKTGSTLIELRFAGARETG